jgi:hypothetical protein
MPPLRSSGRLNAHVYARGTDAGAGSGGVRGVFLYIGASDLVPESYHEHPKALTTAATILGCVTMFAAVRWING